METPQTEKSIEKSTESKPLTLEKALISVTQAPQGVYTITLGGPSEQLVALNVERLTALSQALDQVKEAKARGVIIAGPHQDMFTVGADINLIKNVTDSKQAEELARMGQLVFQKLSLLPCPSVASISGPCLGGGYELALACTHRICSDAKSTLIGLPEIKLGIIPGFGGTQRLPRLIGIVRALDIILTGKTLRAKKADTLGLVSESVPFHRLQDRAVAIVTGTGPTRLKPLQLKEKLLTYTAIGRWFVNSGAQKKISRETKGFYPAPAKALEACLYGLSKGIEEGLKKEAKFIGELIITKESKALVKLFLLTEKSKALGKPALKLLEGLQTVVLGAGTMGAGIANILAQNEFSVVLKDTNEAALKNATTQMQRALDNMSFLSASERSFITSRIEATTRDVPNIARADIIIEAIIENMEIKKQTLNSIAAQVADDSLIGTNTSSLSISELAAGIPNPERVVGVHFFNPVEKMSLLEIVRGKQTADRYTIIAAALAVKLGKFPVIVNDVPGFLVNRILCPYLNTALMFLEKGVPVEVIDRAATSFGMPMGPLRLLDEVGLDVASHVSGIMVGGYGERMKAPEFAKKLAASGALGKKSKLGFYKYTDNSPTVPSPSVYETLSIARSTEKMPSTETISSALILSIVNEALRCLDEGVAGEPGLEAANQIDLASVMGFGFPPFRGGVLHYAESLGVEEINKQLTELKSKFGDRFTAWEGLEKRAKQKKNIV